MKAIRASHTSSLFEHPAGFRLKVAGALAALAIMAVAPGCATRSGQQTADQTPDQTGAALQEDAALPSLAQPGADARGLIGQDLATRHALFKVSAFDSLPGWHQDNLGEAWAAFRESCRALERKPTWKPLCAKVKAIKDPKAGRAFLEREFALLTVQNTDRSRDGDITGYYEPLLQGRTQRDARFNVPIYGVPNDLYILDWKQVPANQRKAVAYVRPNGRLLTLTQASQPGAIRIDLRRFTPDTLDRRLRVRIQGNEAAPYYSRADISRQGTLDAPVLAWVDDPIALYAMQVQGTGRIRLSDGRVLRMQYADQNGHPFRPMQLAAQGNERVQTRGTGGLGMPDEDANIEHFELADEAVDQTMGAPADDASATPPGELVTRGGRQLPARSAASSTDGDVAATVDALTPKPGARRVVTSGTVLNVARPPQSSQLVDDLLTQATQAKQQGGRKPAPAPTAIPGPVVKAKPGQKPTAAAATAAPTPGAVAGVSAALLAQRQRALDADPSYVFFRVAPDQSSEVGPVGALGVPLTAGRSLAVDPRVLPLGYPVFLDAAVGGKREPNMQRLMFAQDTGGAIRGAVRADYFWGFGADMADQECLIADEAFCTDDDLDATSDQP